MDKLNKDEHAKYLTDELSKTSEYRQATNLILISIDAMLVRNIINQEHIYDILKETKENTENK